MSDEAIRDVEPTDRLTRLCEAMTKALEANTEYDDNVKCVVFLSDGDRGGMVIHGYPEGNDIEAAIDVFGHLRCVFEANGKRLDFVAVEVHHIDPNLN